MTRAEWIALGMIAVFIVGMILLAVKVERKRTAWTWLHPPDDDGISLLDDPDGENTR